MRKILTGWLSLAMFALSVPLAEQKGAGDAGDRWKGKQRAEIEAVLGAPLRVKKGPGGGKILVYDGVPRWVVEPSRVEETQGRSRIESERKFGKITTSSSRDEGEAGSAFVMRDGDTVTDKLKIYLDARGIVTKVKLGKRVIE